jgi:hypothetical protein
VRAYRGSDFSMGWRVLKQIPAKHALNRSRGVSPSNNKHLTCKGETFVSIQGLFQRPHELASLAGAALACISVSAHADEHKGAGKHPDPVFITHATVPVSASGSAEHGLLVRHFIP